MNKNLRNLALRCGYTGIIYLKTYLINQVNIFQIYATPSLGYCLMEKHETFYVKTDV